MKTFIGSLQLMAVLALLPACQAEESGNPLRVSDTNDRYFSDDSGKAVYLIAGDGLVSLISPFQDGEAMVHLWK